MLMELLLFILRLVATISVIFAFIFLAVVVIREIFLFTAERNRLAWWSFFMWVSLAVPWVVLSVGMTVFLAILLGTWTFHAIS